MHHDLLQDLAIIMLVAGVTTVIFRLLHQPVVLGYILAGLIIGPHTPPFPLVQDQGVIETLAELGVILLMFSLGLHFSLRNLFRVGSTATIAALLEIVLMVAVGYGIGRAFGWSPMNSIFLGAILAISSTTIIIKALEDLGKTKEKFAEITFGILVVEDIAAIVILALLSGMAVTGSLDVNNILDILAQLAIFLAVVLLAGLILVPRLLRYLARFKSNEMLLVVLLGLCFGVALLALKLGYSVALGAFLIGAVVAESREGPRAAELIEPVRDMFSAVFFVAVGMLIQPAMLLDYALPILVITIAVIVGKVITSSLGAFLGGSDPRTSLRVGMSLAQIGEFSFIIAALGDSLGVTSDFLYPIAVTVSGITTLTTPYLIRYADGAANLMARVTPDSIIQSARLYAQAKPVGAIREDPNLRVRRVFRRSLMQVGLNLLLIAGLFILATAIEPALTNILPEFPPWTGGAKTILWCVAATASMPFAVAVVRKIQGISLLVAEASLGEWASGSRKYVLRSLLSSVLQVIFLVMFAIAFLVMGAPILPPWPIFLILISPVAYIVYRLWGHFIRVYARAQASLRDTFEASQAAEKKRPLPSLLREAEVTVVTLEPGNHAIKKLIRELEVRTHTGASIVAIERGGETIINPNPHEELYPGDRLLLLGSHGQLDAAQAFFKGPGNHPQNTPHSP